MKIYLASRYSRLQEMQLIANELQTAGHEIVSRWVQGNHQIDDEDLNPVCWQKSRQVGYSAHRDNERARFAIEDWEDLHQADVLVCFTEPPRSTNSRGGRHVEFGIALSLRLRVIIVGPRENVFHCLPAVEWYPNLASFCHTCQLINTPEPVMTAGRA